MSPSPGSIFVERGVNRIGSRYKKVVYREYTDDTFRVQKKQQPNQQHLGIMGKTLRPGCCYDFGQTVITNVFSFPPEAP